MTLYSIWRCDRCNKIHNEKTDQRVCADRLACSVRERRLNAKRQDRQIDTENHNA